MFQHQTHGSLDTTADTDRRHKQRKRKSDILCFIRLSQGDTCHMLGTVTLPVNSNTNVVELLQEATALVNNNNNSSKMKYHLSCHSGVDVEFTDNNVPNVVVTSGALLTIKLEIKKGMTQI